MAEFELIPYSSTIDAEWDEFVQKNSFNGTVFHTRRFLRYHPASRFEDASVMIRCQGRIVAVISVCEHDDVFFSHSGTSCGGPVFSKDWQRIERMLPVLELLEHHYQQRLGLRLPEPVFSSAPIDGLHGFYEQRKIEFSEAAQYKSIDVSGSILDSFKDSKTRNAVRSLFRKGFAVRLGVNDDDYRAFHQLVSKNLERHGVVPVHTIDELLRLRDLLSTGQSLFIGEDADGQLQSAVWCIRATEQVVHPQYIARNYESRMRGVVEAVLWKAMEDAREQGASVFNLGISTEDKGRVRNEGLFRFKASLGAIDQQRWIFEPKEFSVV